VENEFKTGDVVWATLNNGSRERVVLLFRLDRALRALLGEDVKSESWKVLSSKGRGLCDESDMEILGGKYLSDEEVLSHGEEKYTGIERSDNPDEEGNSRVSDKI